MVTIESWHAALKIAFDPTSQRIYVGGRAGPRPDTRQPSFFSVAALKPEGTLEREFGEGGVVTLQRVQNPDDELEDIDLDPQRRVLLTGIARVVDGRSYVGLAKVLASGALDSTFADGGWLVSRTSNDESTEPRAATINASGGIFVAGRVQVGTDREWELLTMRVSAEGVPATGMDVRDLGADDGLFGCAVDDASSVTAVGGRKTSGNPTDDAIVVRLLSSGDYDSTWGWGGDAGRIRLTLPDGDDRAYDIALTADGGSIVVGSYAGDTNGFVMALTPQGRPDNTFGPGIDATRTSGHKIGTIARAVTIDSAGRALVVGTSRETKPGASGNATGFVARLMPDGALDDSFDVGGEVGLRRVTAADADVTISGVRVLPSGAIVIAGTVSRGAGIERGFVVSMSP